MTMSKLQIRITTGEAPTKLDDALMCLSEVKKLLKLNKRKLNTNLWSGAANERCQLINKSLIEYEKVLTAIIKDLQKHSEELIITAEDFSKFKSI